MPSKVRKGVLGKEGCKFCGCHGCHPSDMPVMPKHYGKQQQNSHHMAMAPRMYPRKQSDYSYRSYSRSRSRSQSDSRRRHYN